LYKTAINFTLKKPEPSFGIKEDDQALEQMQNYYPDYVGNIFKTDMNEIVKEEDAENMNNVFVLWAQAFYE
jgi:hypothetical protein